MKYISICSGIEAATVAWHGMGWQPLAFSEIEPFPSAVLGHHYPDVPNLGDMTDYLSWPEELLAECDLLVGGTPCQAFSVAGKRESLGDERGNLSLVFCNLFHHINEIRRRHGRPPAIVVWENVPGVLSTKDNAFGCFLAGIMGLDEAVETESGKWHKAGFLSGETVRVGYRIIDAQYFGVAQRRRRVFLVAVPCELVASFGERACPSEILSLRESVLGNPPTRGTAWEGVARTTARSTASSGRVAMHPSVAKTLTQRMHKGFDSTCDSQTPIVTGHPDPAYSLSAGKQGAGGVFGSGRDSQDTFAVVAVRTANTSANGHGVAFTKTKRAQSSTDDESWVPGEVAPMQNQFDVGDSRATTVVAAPKTMQVRRLTPTECERLQGFPDRYTDVTYRNKPAADGPRYKALGNSMAVPCMAWIGYRIQKATRH